ncbi:L-serine dehydratase TdcG [Posidoniimonas corsicana]|uniref:L-serine dehydratase n=1 Tax=Posidoniimonas corsicana TaxID=1938618 RepID=A0A5C5VGC4_9BACT|nr:L-serine ammonia-lyase [Posidoniimonas corsicana]TWT37704.1 L-serine dehydratase TdcG [Posidoniimonas corsicana]
MTPYSTTFRPAERLSIFHMLKVGVGPSSSHTLGPWLAAKRFVGLLGADASTVNRIQVHLYGSLAKTGKGHGTDIAVQMGLTGADPETFPTEQIAGVIADIAKQSRLPLANGGAVDFDPSADIQFHTDQQLPAHPNGMTFAAEFGSGERCEATFYSVGGGFVVQEGETPPVCDANLEFPVDTADELLAHCASTGLPISGVVMRNELAWSTKAQVEAGLDRISSVMIQCVYRGCHAHGVLPGGLGVKRRAADIAQRMLGDSSGEPGGADAWLDAIGDQTEDFQATLDWVSCFALAVNEENAAFGRVVTAPTNGAAGVIPAVLLYFRLFRGADQSALRRFLLTAGEIGCLFKKGATISAAMGGCQAEIGVSSAMAAAALAEGLGGTPQQAAAAAEIAMEHHLGMTCDPIRGLVQIPCIERNVFGAMKAITAARLALQRDPADARVSLDAVIRTMWNTALDMNSKYKETSEGGLAIQIPVNVSEC